MFSFTVVTLYNYLDVQKKALRSTSLKMYELYEKYDEIETCSFAVKDY